MRSARFGFRETPGTPEPRASRMPSHLFCRDCEVSGPLWIYRDGASSVTVYLCDQCREAIALDAFACGEEDSLELVFKS